jgi:hypothetical protein
MLHFFLLVFCLNIYTLRTSGRAAAQFFYPPLLTDEFPAYGYFGNLAEPSYTLSISILGIILHVSSGHENAFSTGFTCP